MPMIRIVRKLVEWRMNKRFVCYEGLDEDRLQAALEIMSRDDDGDGTREADQRGGTKRVQQGSTTH